MMIHRAGSLEGRLMRRLALILAASFLLFAVVYTVMIQRDAHFDAAEETGELTMDMAEAIRVRPGGAAEFDPALVRAQADWPAGSEFAAVRADTGGAVGGSSALLVAMLRARPADQLSSFELVQAASGLNLVSVERVTQNAVPYRIAVSRPMALSSLTLSGLAHEFSTEILPSFLPTLLLALLVTWVTIRVNLRPLRRASAEAGSVSVDRPGQRMSTAGMVREVAPLIDAVNRALTRLEAGIAAQKRFTANAAHELRTPLAVLRARVESFAPGPGRDVLLRDLTRLARVVSQMLLSARVQSHQMGERMRLDLGLLVRGMVADLAPLAQAEGGDIAFETGAAVWVQASAPALESAVRNLIENALRFSPPGAAVLVRVGPGACIEVEDCGPGIPDAERATLFEPFWRAAGQRGVGAGLGLAIVRDVVEQHGGAVAVRTGACGGACFVMTLPEAAGGLA
jgi:signal transduction histidine kinase